ncbi:hypothetical protein WJX75_002601 [Coccomyxa subellipsoidea]|uniref:Zinc-finger domain-containing protein n=1 Tax=Coccomyxa subellipsoidea TaxID=248742 RepID=A0ABR2Z0S0_9CHLO
MEDIRGPTTEDLHRWKGMQGPKLRALCATQESQHPPVRESYSLEHFRRLRRFEARAEFQTRDKVRCIDVHARNDAGCVNCKTCHFCRQKTVEQKTWCPCENGINGRRGTRRGIWCGNCLWLRMGQNLEEVLPLCEAGVWRCPSCLDLCNCSGRSCSRFQKGLEPTEQLHSEAVRQGFKSAAHYLVETLLSEEAVTATIGSVYEGRSHKRARPHEFPEGPHQAARRGARNHKERVQQRAKQKLEEQLALMHEAFSALQQPSVPLDRMAQGVAPMALDADDADESEEEGGADFDSPLGAGAASAAASSSGRGGVAQRRNPVADVAGSAAGTPRDTSPASVSAVAGLFNSDDGRPCKRRRREAGISEQLRDLDDYVDDLAGDVQAGGQWDGAHGGLGGDEHRTPGHQGFRAASWAASGRQAAPLQCHPAQQQPPDNEDDITPMYTDREAGIQQRRSPLEREGGGSAAEAGQNHDRWTGVSHVSLGADEASVAVDPVHAKAAGPVHDRLLPAKSSAGSALPMRDDFLESAMIIPILLQSAGGDPVLVETILAQFRSEWLKTVMDLFGDNVIIPLSTGDNAQHFTLGTLRKVLKVLLAAARVLPEDEVPYTVARRLFGLEQFVDFEASDPATRSHLLSAAFELLDVAWQRSIPLEEITSGIMGFLAVLAKEHEALDEWKQNATTHYIDRESFCIGPFKQDPPWTDDNKVEAEALLELGEKSNELLLKTALDRIALAMLGPGLSEYPSEEHLALLGDPVMGLLDDGARIAAPVRRRALDLLSRVICSVHDPPFSANSGQMEMDDEFLDLLGVRAALGRRLRDAALLQRLEAAVAHRFPQRSAGRGLGAALVAAPLPGERNISEVTDAAFALLAKLYGLLASSNLVKWKDVIPYAMLPYSENRFWTSANTAYRNFAALFLANVLEVFPQPLPALHAALLHMWLHALLDTERRETAYWLTLGVSRVAGGVPECPGPGEIFWAAGAGRRELQKLRHDKNGDLRADLVRSVFRFMAVHHRWRERFRELLGDIGEVLGKRAAEARRPRELAAWQQAAAGILLGAVSGAGLGQCHCRQGTITCSCGGAALVTVLTHVSRWACSASMALQQWWAAASAQLEALDPARPLETLEGNARSRLETKTVFRHVLPLLRMIASTSFAVRSPPPTLPVLELLRTVLMCAVEVPTGDEKSNPADAVLYDGVAKALVCEGDAQPPLPDLAGESQDPSMRMLHYLIGTQLQRHLERACFARGRNAATERCAVNTLRLLCAVLSRPAMRGSSTAFRTFLPPLLRPLLDLLRPPGTTEEPSIAAKEALYAVLMHLLQDSAAVIVPPVLAHGDPPAAASARVLIGRAGSLQQCQPLAEDKWHRAMQLFLRALCRDVLACVAGASDTVSPGQMQQHDGLTPLDHQGAHDAREALFFLLGQPRPQDTTKRVFEAKPPFEIPATYEPSAADDAIDLSLGERQQLAPQPPPRFRPGDFRWRLAERAIGFLGALAASGAHGASWAAMAAPSLRALLAANVSLRSMLSGAYLELLAALEAAGQDTRKLALPTRAPRAAAGPSMRAALAGPPRSGGPGSPVSMPPEQAMQENQPPPSDRNMAAPVTAVKQEPQAAEVMTSLAGLQATSSSAALVTLRMPLACAPTLKTKESDKSKVLLLKLTDTPNFPASSALSNAGQPVVTIFWTHHAESLHREIQARGVSGWHCTVNLTNLQRLRAGTMNGLKSTQTSRASLLTDPTSSAFEAPEVPSRQVTAGSLQASTVAYEGASTLPCTNDTEAGPSTLQACTPYDPVEAGRARMEALLRRLQEMGFGFEAAKGALKTATREGLIDQPALERAAELLMSAGAG